MAMMLTAAGRVASEAGARGPGRRTALRAALLAAALLGGQAAQAGSAPSLLDRLSGTWTGTGVAGLSATASERVACRVDYRPAEGRRLHVDLRCAGGGYHVEVAADLAREGTRLIGDLVERSVGASGTLSGEVGADRLEAVVTAMGLSARLSLSARGRLQAVTLRGLGSLSAASATVRLRPL